MSARPGRPVHRHGLEAARILRDEARVTRSASVRLLLLVMSLESVVLAEQRGPVRPRVPLPLPRRVAEVAVARVCGAPGGGRGVGGFTPAAVRSTVLAAYRARGLALGLAPRALPDHLVEPLLAELGALVGAVLDAAEPSLAGVSGEEQARYRARGSRRADTVVP